MEGDASEDFGLTREGSKPLLARYVAERIELEEASAAWQQLRELAEAIGQLAPDDPEAEGVPPEVPDDPEAEPPDDDDDVIPF